MQNRPFAREAGSKVDSYVQEIVITEEFHSDDWSHYSHAIYNTELFTHDDVKMYMIEKDLI